MVVQPSGDGNQQYASGVLGQSQTVASHQQVGFSWVPKGWWRWVLTLSQCVTEASRYVSTNLFT